MRRGRAVVGLTLLIGLALLAPGLPTLARLGQRAQVDASVLADTVGGGRASVVVYLADQAEVAGASAIRDHNRRGRFVHDTLTGHAGRSQAPLQNWLKRRGIAFQSFWVANMLVLEADRALLDDLAARPDVARIDSNRPVRGIEDPELADITAAPTSVNAVEPGVNNVNAPDVWQLGYRGEGIVIGSSDTGVRWTHTALRNAYRGWNGKTADHDYNWYDAIHSGGGSCGANTTAPCDDSGHGTHTVGTLVGDGGASNRVGVAPGAKWIGCRSMNQGVGTPARYSECFQFFLAPTDLGGNNADPDLRPDIVNNSWACPASEGCTTGAELKTIVNNLTAAGIFVVASAGNAGSSCATVQFAPAMYRAAFSVGAIDSANNHLAAFSSRGPSKFYSPNVMKPELAAPGVNVRSASRTSNTAYTLMTGTSMAAPHVAGVVALLWSARPELVGNVDATRAVLEDSANPAVTVDPPERCGGLNSWDVPNNSFGYGRVDALAALEQPVPTPTSAPSPSPSPTDSPAPTDSPTPSDSPDPTPTPTGPADTTAPDPPQPTAELVSPQTIGATVAVRVSWPPASDPSGIASYDLLKSTNGGAWATVNLPEPTATAVDLALAPGNGYEFTLRATDGAGNSGGYATTTDASLVLKQETATGIAYSGTWSRLAAAGASGGYVRKSTTAASSATYTFSGTNIGFVSTVGPGRGMAEIWLDGAMIATLDLYAASGQQSRLVWAASVAPGSHTLQVRVTGTKNPASSGWRVDVDAFLRWT